MTDHTLILINNTGKEATFYYNLPPKNFYNKTKVGPNEKTVIEIKNLKYLVGIIDQEYRLMCPRAFYTDVTITLSINEGIYYYRCDFNEKNDGEIVSDLLVWFCDFVADLYKRKPCVGALYEQPKQDELISFVSKMFIIQSYAQIPADYFAKCYCKFLSDDTDYMKIKNIYQSMLNTHLHKVCDLTKIEVL